MDRKERRQLIQELVTQQRINTQHDLLAMLAEHGIDATQATISRDIHALNIVKVSDQHGHTYYSILHTHADEYQRLFDGISHNVEKVTNVQFINVIQTTLNSNYATVLAGLFDNAQLPEVVGTLAGNDTLLTISKNNEDAQALNRLIKEHMTED